MEIVSSHLDSEALNLFEKILREKRSEVARQLVEYEKKSKAVEPYKNKKVSLGLGAKLAGTTLSEFIDLLGEHNISLNLEKDEIKKALDIARDVL